MCGWAARWFERMPPLQFLKRYLAPKVTGNSPLKCLRFPNPVG